MSSLPVLSNKGYKIYDSEENPLPVLKVVNVSKYFGTAYSKVVFIYTTRKRKKAGMIIFYKGKRKKRSTGFYYGEAMGDFEKRVYNRLAKQMKLSRARLTQLLIDNQP